MKNVVINTTDLIKVLHQLNAEALVQQTKILTDGDAKKATMEALNGSPGERIISMKVILDNIKLEGYIRGVLFVTQYLEDLVTKQTNQLENANGSV